ncbi:MAG: ATP-binding cassette domain-containing protein [Dehalogenimonas sp.]|uniref:ATP-binding cassette domain-containing protein n=1 Tax=Candidatus Dehalogenimonas loeffleri TaxID=3127115 RepID=A0ABZ2J5C9_9CHLR|nr:ATP-binding cassette domain-containing protein [Dehalogenimonas sp.]
MADNSKSPIIEVSGLHRSFGKLEAVKDVSFTVGEGEIFGFLGPNGAGKTTTINILCTLLLPTSGNAKVNGYDVIMQTDDVRRSIGLVFQEPTLDDYLNAEQNLRFHAYAYGVPPAERETRIRELMEMVELWDRRKDQINTFSGGMKRRLEIARGLIHQPKVLFLDEPTIGLDPQTRRNIWDHIKRLQEQTGLTIFMTTHYMEEAENCDRIAIIDYGKIVALGTPEKLKDSVGGDLVTIKTADNNAAIAEIRQQFGIEAGLKDDNVVFSVQHGEQFLPEFVRQFTGSLLSVGIRRPTLDDVFLKHTGREIRAEAADPLAMIKRQRRIQGGMH